MVGQQLFAGEATRLAYGTDEAVEGRDSFLQKRSAGLLALPLGVLSACRDLLQLLPVPTGDGCSTCCPGCARALDGDGPALLPVPAGDDAATARAGRRLWPPARRSAAARTIRTTRPPSWSRRPARPARPRARCCRPRRCWPRPGPPGPFLTGPDERPAHWLLALPAQHIAGLQVLQRSLAEGTEPTVLDTEPAVHRDPVHRGGGPDARRRAVRLAGAHPAAADPGRPRGHRGAGHLRRGAGRRRRRLRRRCSVGRPRRGSGW